jgi:prolyl 4-hydroxylase
LPVRQAVPADERIATARAVELLGGSTKEVLRAISLIDAAADRNDPVALERKALLEAVGCGRRQSWDRALDCLAIAAELGSEPAREQLHILARSPRDESNWGRIRSGISVEKLLEVPQKHAVSDAPRLRMIKGFASTGECLWLLGRARDRMRPALVVTPGGRQTKAPSRTNSGVEFQLVDMDVVVELLRARISAATHLPLPLFETSQVLHYAPGQEFRAHHDYFDPGKPGHIEQLKSGQRIATFLIYLNDGYTGGETAFPRAMLTFRGDVGDALFIANVERSGKPDPLTLHAGSPPASGEKWIFSQWIRDKPFGSQPGPEAE